MEFERDGIKYYDEFAEYASQIAPEEWDYFDLADSLSDQIYHFMQAKGITKSELAKRLGNSRPFVSKVLAGDMNVTLKTLAKILHHLGARAEVKVVDSQHEIMWMGFVTKARKKAFAETWQPISLETPPLQKQQEPEPVDWRKLAA